MEKPRKTSNDEAKLSDLAKPRLMDSELELAYEKGSLRFTLAARDGEFLQNIYLPDSLEPLISLPLSEQQFRTLKSVIEYRISPAQSAMPIEQEAKFLLVNIPDLAKARRTNIVQDYLFIGSDGTEIRIRDKDGTYTQTVKLCGAKDATPSAEIGNPEAEIELSKDQYSSLRACPTVGNLEKTRHLVELGSLTLELDQYKGKYGGLWVLEVEGSISDIEWVRNNKPSWLGAEVTSDTRFRNKNILSHGIPAGTELHNSD